MTSLNGHTVSESMESAPDDSGGTAEGQGDPRDPEMVELASPDQQTLKEMNVTVSDLFIVPSDVLEADGSVDIDQVGARFRKKKGGKRTRDKNHVAEMNERLQMAILDYKDGKQMN